MHGAIDSESRETGRTGVGALVMSRVRRATVVDAGEDEESEAGRDEARARAV